MAGIGPRKKISVHKSNQRHSTWERLTLKDLSTKYNVTKCSNCGYYKGKQVVTIKTKSSDKVVEA